jgi:hypothetical protein
MQRQIPHEIMHILVYRFVNEKNGTYAYIPAWLSEGLASNTELSANPDYQAILSQAWEDNRLLPMKSLCDGFPTDPSLNLLAYAQSTAFTSHLHQQFGSTGLEKLLLAYADGLECERGANQALGLSLTGLEQKWLADTFGVPAQPANTTQAYTWFFLLGLFVLFPLLLVALHRSPQTNLSQK